MRQFAEAKTKPLRSVWIKCVYPVLALGLRDILKDDAYVYLDNEIPEGVTPSCIILCPVDADDLSSEIGSLQSQVPESPILVFGVRVDHELARTSLQAGAQGFIHAGMEPGQIIRALSVAARGQIVVPRELVMRLVVGEEPVNLDILTLRQREILKLVADGLTNTQIARRLFLSESTIKQHLRAAYKLLKVKNRTEAAKLIRQSRSMGA